MPKHGTIGARRRTSRDRTWCTSSGSSVSLLSRSRARAVRAGGRAAPAGLGLVEPGAHDLVALQAKGHRPLWKSLFRVRFGQQIEVFFEIPPSPTDSVPCVVSVVGAEARDV